ncbi:unnamed protein product, partial [Coccothraustes coccothraustes]
RRPRRAEGWDLAELRAEPGPAPQETPQPQRCPSASGRGRPRTRDSPEPSPQPGGKRLELPGATGLLPPWAH